LCVSRLFIKFIYFVVLKLQDLLDSDTIANGSKVEDALKIVDMIANGSKDVGSSNTTTVNLTNNLVDIYIY
jgi:hypothetical protein